MAEHTVDADDEEPPLLLDRASRASRGKRITKLLEGEVEQDEVFWNQDALKEDENDDNYEEEQDAGDEFDSDFGEDESEPDDEPEKEARESLPIKKRLIFPGKTLKKIKAKKKKVISKLEDEGKTDKSSDKPSPSKQADIPDELETEKTIRKSTRTSVIVRQAERDAIRAEKEATVKPIKKKKEGEEKRMTQEEMLLEAAETEIMNLRNLERVLAREEEVKKKAVVHKAVYEGPTVRFCSRNGESHLEFINGASFGSELCTTSAPYPEKSVCVVTGLPAKDFSVLIQFISTSGSELHSLWTSIDRYSDPSAPHVYLGRVPSISKPSAPSSSKVPAFLTIVPVENIYYFFPSTSTRRQSKYRDPKTGLPYATMEAFKIIRESFLKEEADKKRPNMSNMGALFESITGEQSTPKKRRIEARSPNVSADQRIGGRFRRVPALDMLDED